MYFVLFGDSIAVGQKISVHESWAVSLSRALTDLEPEIIFQNASVNGNTTRLALERLGSEVLALRPKFVIVQFGLNDSNFWESDFGKPRVSRRAFRANLSEILEKISSVGPKQVFINTNHPSRKSPYKHQSRISHGASSAKYNEVIREVADEYARTLGQITLIDVERDWALKEEEVQAQLLLQDGVHLSALGHKAYSELVVPIVLAKLRKPRES